jgi:hypothetical protein
VFGSVEDKEPMETEKTMSSLKINRDTNMSEGRGKHFIVEVIYGVG